MSPRAQDAPIYLDNAATTPVDSSVAEAMSKVHLQTFGNPSSRHPLGLQAEQELRRAREQLSRTFGVDTERVTFTSGGSEALALAILGSAGIRRRPGHVLISAIEHPATLRSAAILARRGHRVETIPCTEGGWIDPETVSDRLRDDTFLVATMHVNNETGIISPIESIADAIRHGARRCRLLVDAVQSLGKIDVSTISQQADLVVTSAHKVHGPKGVGALIRRSKDDRLVPLWGGGDQEAGLRPGTENVAGVVGFGRAVRHSTENGALCADAKRAQALRGYSETLRQALADAGLRSPYLIGDPARRAPHIAAIASCGVPAEVLINALGARGVILSSGSACHSRKTLRSHVLSAMKIPAAHQVLRFSFSAETNADAIDRAAALIVETIRPLTRSSPR